MIDSNEFKKIREDLSGQDPVIKRVRLSGINFADNSIARGVIVSNGQEVPVSRSFFHRLGHTVGLNVSLLSQMDKKADNQVQQKLLEAMKTYSENTKANTDFYLVGDPSQRRIVNLVKADNYSRLTNDTLFQTAETLLNEVPSLHIDSVDRTGEGNISINLLNSSEHGLESLGKDEVFRFGISLVNNPNRSFVEQYVERLACANGMIAPMKYDETDKVKKSDMYFKGMGGASDFRHILNAAKAWSKEGFIPANFSKRLDRAMNTPASLMELNRAYNRVAYSLKEEDPDRRFKLMSAIKQEFFHQLDETERRLISKGYDPMKMAHAETKFIKTGASIWDVINTLTWLGSHKSLYDLNQSLSFKVEGGQLFANKWDLEHADLMQL